MQRVEECVHDELRRWWWQRLLKLDHFRHAADEYVCGEFLVADYRNYADANERERGVCVFLEPVDGL